MLPCGSIPTKFLIGRVRDLWLPLGADAPCQGEMSRKDKGGRDSWLREAQTDEGLYAPNICMAVSVVLPNPHPALRATFPGGEGFGVHA